MLCCYVTWIGRQFQESIRRSGTFNPGYEKGYCLGPPSAPMNMYFSSIPVTVSSQNHIINDRKVFIHEQINL